MSISVKSESRQRVMDESFVHTYYPPGVCVPACYILDVLDCILEGMGRYKYSIFKSNCGSNSLIALG